jgi:hypothetical protein
MYTESSIVDLAPLSGTVSGPERIREKRDEETFETLIGEDYLPKCGIV